jgi:uncharacterized protein YcfL
MSKNMKQVTFLPVLMLLLAGCNQLRPPIEPQSDPYLGKQIYLDSYQLRSDTAVGTPVRSRDPYGIMHIMVPVRSIIDKQLHVQYRVYFLDRNQNIVSEIGWTDKTLTANTPDQIEFNSSNAAAEDFQLHLRYPPGYAL